jgi:uncharacterized protein
MLDGYVAAIVAGPVSIDPPDWICPLLAVDTDAFNHAITAAPRSSRGDLRRRATSQRHQPRSIDHSETVRADAPAQVQWRSRSASLVPRILRCHAAADVGLGTAARYQRVNHRLLLPILLHCRDNHGRPLLGPPRRGRKTREFLRNAHADIPALVEAMRQYWMPTRYARAS